jgi:hypothetical protein
MIDAPLVNVPGLSYDLLLGIITSLLSNVFMKLSLPDWAKQAIVLVIAVLFAVGRCILTDSFTGTNLSASILLVIGVAYGAYQTFLKDLGQSIQAKVGITDKTPTPVPAPVEPQPPVVGG